MPWPNSSRPTGHVVTAANWNEVVAALSLWGGNTDAAGYQLQNLSTVRGGDGSTISNLLVAGGTGTTSTLTLRPTTGVGTTNSDIIFGVGNNGGTEAMRILHSGRVGVGTATPGSALHVVGALSMEEVLEKCTISATAATGTIQYDAVTQAVLYYTSNASANWTLNIRGNSSTTLNTLMATGQSMTVVFLVTNGTTAYRQTGFTIDGSAVTPRWLGGTAPSAGNASAIDCYTITIIKTGNAAFTALESLAQFK